MTKIKKDPSAAFGYSWERNLSLSGGSLSRYSYCWNLQRERSINRRGQRWNQSFKLYLLTTSK